MIRACRHVRAATGVVLLGLVSSRGSTQEQGAVPVFPSEGEAITVDVVVVDRDGRPVLGLNPADFTLLEDGRAQKITAFEARRLTEPAGASPGPNGAPASEPASVPAAPPKPGRVLIFLVDDLGLDPIRSGADVKKAIASWISTKADPGDRVTLLTTSGEQTWSGAVGTGASDLLATLARIRGRRLAPWTTAQPMSEWEAYKIIEGGGAPYGPASLPEAPGAAAPAAVLDIVQRVAQRWASHGGGLGHKSDVIARAGEIYGATRRRAAALFGAVTRISESFAGVRGRKSIFVFSEGLLRDVDRDPADRAVDASQRANTAVYFVDARGLVALPGVYDLSIQYDAPSPQTIALMTAEMPLETAGTEYLAEATGGTSVHDTNDLLGGLTRIAEESAAYYLLGFQPEMAPDGKWHKLKVRIARPNVTVRARKGYYAAGRHEPERPPYEAPLVAALESETPPRDLDYRVGLLYFDSRPDTRESLILVEVPLSVPRTHLALLGLVRDEDGRIVDRMSHDWPLEEHAGPSGSATFKGWLDLAPGRYLLETAVRDADSGQVGVQRTPVDVPAPVPGLGLSSLVLLRSAGEGAAGVEGPHDPLQVASLALVPRIAASFPQGTPDVSCLLHVYRAKAADPLQVTIDVRRDGQIVGQSSPSLPAPDGSGQIAWIGSVAIGSLAPGVYDLHASVQQGALVAEERTSFEVVPAPPASLADSGGKDPALAAIVASAGRYVVEYEQAFRDLVAEETYEQWEGRTLAAPSRHSVLRADLVFTVLPGPFPWGCFRDVFEVDGAMVHDRDARLEKLFVSGSPASAVEHAKAILKESSRYNIGIATRNMNMPTLPLLFLHPSNRDRFRFELKGNRRVQGRESLEVRFTEVGRPTLVTGESGDRPADGSFWIDMKDGTVLRSEVRFRFPLSQAKAWLTVDYRPEPGLQIWVPDRMGEIYRDFPESASFSDSEAKARYSNYRRFSVSTKEAVVPPSQ